MRRYLLLCVFYIWSAYVYGGLFWHPPVPDHGYEAAVYVWRISAAAPDDLRRGAGSRAFLCDGDQPGLCLCQGGDGVFNGRVQGDRRFADAYEAEFQRDGRLYLTGKSNAFRTVLSVGVFLGSLNATHNLVGSCLAAVLAQLAGVCLFDFSVIGHLPQVDWEVRSGRVGLLFKRKCSPVFIGYSGFLYFFCREICDRGQYGGQVSGGIGAIFMPTSVINLVAGFVIRPYITKLSDQWERNALPEFAGTVGRLAAIIAALTALAVGGAWILESRSLNVISEDCVHAAGMPPGAGVYHSGRRV